MLAGIAAVLAGCDIYFDSPKVTQPAAEEEALRPPPPPPPPPTPLPGSEQILFMDSTTAQLGGCRSISSVRLTRQGAYGDGMVLLRNAAIQINANRMIPIRLVENINDADGPHLFHVKLVRCPDPKPQDPKPKGSETNG